jgi:hypothetical protein
MLGKHSDPLSYTLGPQIFFLQQGFSSQWHLGYFGLGNSLQGVAGVLYTVGCLVASLASIPF